VQNTVLRAGTPDVIAYAFYQLGFRPRESLILIGLRSPRRRLGLVARVDLPPPEQLERMLSVQIDTLRSGGDEGAIVLLVSDAADTGPVDPGVFPMPHRELAAALARHADRLNWPLRDVVLVGPTRWRSYQCDQPGCCPPEGFPLAAVSSSATAACLVASGRRLAPDEDALVADVEAADPDPPAGADPGPDPAEDPDPGEDPGEDLDDEPADEELLDAGVALARWRRLMADPQPSAGLDLGWLGSALQDHWFRDAVMLTLVPDSGTAAEELLAGADAAVMNGMLDRQPDPDLLERGRVLLAAVARSAARGERADALAVLAWMSWWSGDGVRCRLLTARALADQPGHRLAGLVERLRSVGKAPGWLDRRCG